MEEQALLEQLRRRKRGALERAITLYTPYISAVVWRTAGGAAGREDLEEAVADVFLSLWTHAGELDAEKGGLRAWLGAVARNRAANLCREKRDSLPLDESTPDGRPGPEEEAGRRDDAERLWRTIEALEEPDREIFLRYYFYEEKIREIATALELNQSTVKTKLARGRTKLRAMLMERGNQYEQADGAVMP